MTKEKGERPKFVTEEHLHFLDNLRESGVTNMWGATPYLLDRFPMNLSDNQAKQVLFYWMHSFSERH